MKISFTTLLFALLCFNTASFCQTSSIDIKDNRTYAEQKAITNDINAKTKIIPFSLPDPQSLVSLNQSGDGIITIPLVTAKGRKLTLPISLTYVTSGIKINQPSSEVGLGWQINIGSITRNYGAFEPDYTYTGPEGEMLYKNGETVNGTVWDKKLNSYIYNINGQVTPAVITDTTIHQDNPYNQNKEMSYTTKSNPDSYDFNIPGLPSDDFWNSNDSIPPYGDAPPQPDFIFSEQKPWKISYEKKTFAITQELSRINEFNFDTTSSGDLLNHTSPFGASYNVAAAIAMYPYVINQSYSSFNILGIQGIDIGSLYGLNNDRSPFMTVTYEDYSKFTITTEDGTQYVFGRPLRGQKYLFTDEPFWSAMSTYPYQQGGPNDYVYDEFWKTDYIAEWLLTEIRSNDYADANNDGIADDGDYGDWIRIDYTDTTQNVGFPGIDDITDFKEPLHREWQNFTQTDQPSSLMRERAYVTKITTPIEIIDFTNSQKFDVDFDYFSSVFNRINDHYKYDSTRLYPDDAWQFPLTNVYYPLELRKYDTINVHQNFDTDTSLIQNVQLKYASQGSSQELAVSNMLILDDSMRFTDYDPSTYGQGLMPQYFYKANGRGKTTLTGIDFRGSNTQSTPPISYKFSYNYNPRYDSIHLFQIWKQGTYPAIRESLRSDLNTAMERWVGYKTIAYNGGSVIDTLPNSILPWKSIGIDSAYHVTKATVNWGYPVREDEMGYYYDSTQANKGRDAWSLTSITLPYGGNINLSYERDQVSIDSDRSHWLANGGFADYCLPSVGHFNNVAHLWSIYQDRATKHDPNFDSGNYIPLCDEYYFMMNQYTGGLRIKQIDYTDPYGSPTVTRKYSYGDGHWTIPPPDYWQNYLQGYSEFITDERLKYQYNKYAMTIQAEDYSAFKQRMLRLVTNVRIDNSIYKMAKHYYDYVEETDADSAKTKWYYGKLINRGQSTPAFTTLDGLIKKPTFDRENAGELLAAHYDPSTRIGNYETQYLNASNMVVKQVNNDYSYSASDSFALNTPSDSLFPYAYTAYIRKVVHTGDIDNTVGLIPCDSTGYYWLMFEGLYTPAKPEGIFWRFDTVLHYMEYTNAQSGNLWDSVALNSEAREPLYKLGADLGVYQNLPSWFTDLTHCQPPIDQSHFTNLQNGFTNALHWMKDEIINFDNSGRTEYIMWIDAYSHIDPLRTFSHISYQLKPTHTSTITYF